MSQPPRFFLNHDGSHLMWIAPPVSLDQFSHEILGVTEGTQVDGIVHHMFTCGDCVPLFHCDIADAEPVMPEALASCHVWRCMHNRAALLEMPEDPWQIVIAAAHAQGKPFWGSMRFNDGHPPEYGPRSRFGVEHPECFIGDDCAAGIHAPGPDGVVPPCRHLNFALPVVREHRKALIAGLCSRYEVDGFEWDFTRDNGHNFTKADAGNGVAILNDYMREIRKLLDDIAEQRGRPLGFGVRVPGTLEVCKETGLDVETWIREGLVNMLTPTVYYDTTCELPYRTFVELARGTATKIYGNVSEGVGPGRFRPPPREAVRAGVANAWRDGVDGVNIFNFHHHIVDNRIDDMVLYSECGDPATVARKDKLYMVAGVAVPSQSRFFGMDYETWHPRQVPVDVPKGDGPGVMVRVPISDDIEAARRDRVLASIVLRLDLLNMTGHEKLRLLVNGKEVLINSAKWGVSKQYPFNWNGMHGDMEATFDLTGGDWIQEGDNEVNLILLERPDDIAPPFTLYTVRLEINYNILPMGLA
jgi:hypothetical protein